MLDYFLVFSVILNLILGYYFVVTFFKILPKYEEKLKFIAEEFQRGYQRLRQADLQGAFENDDYVGDAFTRIKNIYSDLSKYLTDEKYEEKQKEEK